jgi:ElaB/YqjD/DUF883 family membrane-anchored ribosome-binding protein
MMSETSTADLQRTIDNLSDRVDTLQRQAKARARQSVESTKQAVRDYPAIALGVSFAAGLLMGVLLGWKGRERTMPNVVEVEE